MEPQKTANPENITGKPPVNSANSLQDGGNLPDRVQHHADAILRASGSGLRNYSMESTKLAILSASLKFAEEMVRRGALIAQQETERATVEKIVAWLRDGADAGFLDAASAIEAGEWRA